jgi:hypothetical protein
LGEKAGKKGVRNAPKKGLSLRSVDGRCPEYEHELKIAKKGGAGPLEVGPDALRPYSHCFSPRTFPQPQ